MLQLWRFWSQSSKCKKSKNYRERNIVEVMSQEVAYINLCVVTFEVNLVGSNPCEQWIDTCVTRHMCYDKEMFANLDDFDNSEKLYMRNSGTSVIKFRGKMILKLIYGK